MGLGLRGKQNIDNLIKGRKEKEPERPKDRNREQESEKQRKEKEGRKSSAQSGLSSEKERK